MLVNYKVRTHGLHLLQPDEQQGRSGCLEYVMATRALGKVHWSVCIGKEGAPFDNNSDAGSGSELIAPGKSRQQRAGRARKERVEWGTLCVHVGVWVGSTCPLLAVSILLHLCG